MHDTAVLYYGRFVLIAVMVPAIALLGWRVFKMAGRANYSWIRYYNQPRRRNSIALIYAGAGIIFWNLIAFGFVLPAIVRASSQFAGLRAVVFWTFALIFLVGIGEMMVGFVLWRRQKRAGQNRDSAAAF
jgi:hypothetical protein